MQQIYYESLLHFLKIHVFSEKSPDIEAGYIVIDTDGRKVRNKPREKNAEKEKEKQTGKYKPAYFSR